ncbi:MAG: cytochrome b [Rhodobacteraceae bacterium]|nr:MAG: cytochrome b [Paracoccaceae bacterium]
MPRRYHPALITLHWLLALFLIGALIAGRFILTPQDNADPAKLISFTLHMGLGLTILALMLVRLGVRFSTAHPPRALTGQPLPDRLAPLTHWALYAVAIAMSVSGIVMSRQTGLPDAVFGDGPMPADFDDVPARAVHGVLSMLLMALIALHVAAALWHQFIRRDGLMARMWFGPR